MLSRLRLGRRWFLTVIASTSEMRSSTGRETCLAPHRRCLLDQGFGRMRWPKGDIAVIPRSVQRGRITTRSTITKERDHATVFRSIIIRAFSPRARLHHRRGAQLQGRSSVHGRSTCPSQFGKRTETVLAPIPAGDSIDHK
jgi:hypothetical protein